MSNRPRFRPTIFSSLVLCAACAGAQEKPAQKLDQQFQSAVGHYHEGQFAEAASQLEDLLPQVPKSFEAHELLGLVYAAESQDTKSVEQLQIAVDLKPDSPAARTNLAAALVRAGKARLGRRTISQGARPRAEGL